MPPATRGVVAKKPPSFFWKPLKIDGWGLFQAVAKCGKALWEGNAVSALEEALKAVQCIKFKDKDGELAWALVYNAMTRAAAGFLGVLQPQLAAGTHERLVAAAIETDRKLEAAGVTLNQDFFDHPGWCDYVRAVAQHFRHWLIAVGVDEPSADNLSRELPQQFTLALDLEWLKNKDLFAKLLPQNRRTPFSTATQYELAWARYAGWLDDEADRRVFDEDFGLTRVYIPLRAFVETRDHNRNTMRTVGLAEDMLDAWMEKARTNDPIRVVEGDPGAGKSSLARRFAANRFGRHCAGRWWRVVYVPLHDDSVAAGRSIEEAAAACTQRVSGTNLAPLERDAPDGTLLILDGLDELSRGGQFGHDVIRAFMSQVTGLLKAWNDRDDARLLVLLCGRPVAVGEIKAEVRAEGAVLNLLPFLVEVHTAPELFKPGGSANDPQGLLQSDQRKDWYEAYAAARGRTDGEELYAKIKDRADLNTITAQPLLNYLVAFLTRGAETGELPGNLCGVYETLLHKVWQRDWDRTQVPAIEKLDYEPFCQLLETIALSAWHSGNPRSIRVGEVEDRLTTDQKTQLATFEKEVKAGVLRLLFAFFLRPGAVERGDQTYEFTHKTFAEYLVTRRLVREIDMLAEDWKRSAGGRGWKDETRLQEWAELFGPTALDDDMRKFLEQALAAEVDRRNQQLAESGKESALSWQKVLAQLLNAAVRDGMPMHAMSAKLKPAATFREMNRQALNSEIAFLHTLNACSALTKTRSRIPALEQEPQDWMGGRWFRPMQGLGYYFLSLQTVDWSDRSLALISLPHAELSEANLRGAVLSRTNLRSTNLSKANLLAANLHLTYAIEANLSGGNLNNAFLAGANLGGANLSGANLSWANLSWANLSWANLSGADMSGANLSDAVGLTAEQLQATIGDPATMPDREQPKKNWRTAKPRTRKKTGPPTPHASAPTPTNPDPPPPAET